MTSARLFLEGFASATDCSAWANDVPGTFVCEDRERLGTGRVSACRVVGGAVASSAPRTILRADPALAGALAPLVSNEHALSDEDFLGWSEDHSSTQHGATVLGRGLMKTIDQPVEPAGRAAQRLNWDEPSHIAMIENFIERVDDDDLDEAEIERDDLDSLATCLVNDAGQIEAYASARPFDEAIAFGDIGIAVAAEVRRRGLGKAVLRSLIRDVLTPAGVHPLYRCDPDNNSSHKLSASLGFETVLEIVAIEVQQGCS